MCITQCASSNNSTLGCFLTTASVRSTSVRSVSSLKDRHPSPGHAVTAAKAVRARPGIRIEGTERPFCQKRMPALTCADRPKPKPLPRHISLNLAGRWSPAWENILATLLPAPLACCRWELERRHMTPPSDFALRIIVEEDPKLVRVPHESPHSD
jgi:hypothetical protein